MEYTFPTVGESYKIMRKRGISTHATGNCAVDHHPSSLNWGHMSHDVYVRLFFFLSFNFLPPPKGESVDSDAICSTFSTRDNFSLEFSSSFKGIRLKIGGGGFIFLFSLSTSTVFSSSSFYEVSGQDFDLWVELLPEKEAGENFFFWRERERERL